MLTSRARVSEVSAPVSAPEPEPVADPVPGPVAMPEAAKVAVANGANFSLDDVIEAWPDVLGQLKAPTRAAVQDAQPIAIEAGVIVFGVPARRREAINERFRKEAAVLKEAFAVRLGSQPRFTLRAHNFDAVDALRPSMGSDTAASQPVPVTVADDAPVDLHDLVDAHDAPPNDSVARLVADLGASVVEERPR